MAATTQICHSHGDGRAHYDKKITEGKTHNEALRCLNCRISDAIYVRLHAGVRQAASSANSGSGGQPGNEGALGLHLHFHCRGSTDSATTPRPRSPTAPRLRIKHSHHSGRDQEDCGIELISPAERSRHGRPARMRRLQQTCPPARLGDICERSSASSSPRRVAALAIPLHRRQRSARANAPPEDARGAAHQTKRSCKRRVSAPTACRSTSCSRIRRCRRGPAPGRRRSVWCHRKAGPPSTPAGC